MDYVVRLEAPSADRKRRFAWLIALISMLISVLAHNLLIAQPQLALAQQPSEIICQPLELTPLQPIDLTNHAAGVTSSIESISYTIDGSSPDQWRQQLLGCSPVPINNGVAMVQSQVSYTFTYRQASVETCSVVDAKIGLQQRIVMPKLTSNELTEQSHSKWQAFYAALDLHEQGHLERNQQYAESMQHQLQQLSSSCSSIEDAASRLINQLQTAMNHDNATYDQQTGHGRTQGVKL